MLRYKITKIIFQTNHYSSTKITTNILQLEQKYHLRKVMSANYFWRRPRITIRKTKTESISDDFTASEKNSDSSFPFFSEELTKLFTKVVTFSINSITVVLVLLYKLPRAEMMASRGPVLSLLFASATPAAQDKWKQGFQMSKDTINDSISGASQQLRSQSCNLY